MELAEIAVERAYTLRTEVLGWAEPSLRIDAGAAHTALVDGADVVGVISHVTWPCPDEPGVAYGGRAVGEPYTGPVTGLTNRRVLLPL